MNRMILKSRVGSDGVLHVEVPLGMSEANRDVEIIIDAVPRHELTQEEWRKWVESMAGSITDPSLARHEQGEYDQRDELP